MFFWALFVTMYILTQLNVLALFSGTAGDSLSGNRGYPFTTKDQDNDGKHSSFADGINWYHWKGDNYSAKRAEIKIRPSLKNFLLYPRFFVDQRTTVTGWLKYLKKSFFSILMLFFLTLHFPLSFIYKNETHFHGCLDVSFCSSGLFWLNTSSVISLHLAFGASVKPRLWINEG